MSSKPKILDLFCGCGGLLQGGKTIVMRMKNPFALAEQGKIEVYPTVFQINFNADNLEERYEGR